MYVSSETTGKENTHATYLMVCSRPDAEIVQEHTCREAERFLHRSPLSFESGAGSVDLPRERPPPSSPAVAAISHVREPNGMNTHTTRAAAQDIRSHMENLSLHDAGPQGQPDPSQQGQNLAMSQPVPQLPPQMFTTAAQLLDLTDSE